MWRQAEAKAADLSEPWPGRVDDAASEMAVEPVTVARWRKTVPSVAAWRAWLHEAFDRYDTMAEAIDRGDFDSMAGAATKPTRGRDDYLGEIVPKLAGIVTAAQGRRATTAELARRLGISRRAVGRYRTD